jgi:hypothetical protein
MTPILNVLDAAWSLTDVEYAVLNLKKELCDGNMLKGYTAKADADVNTGEVLMRLEVLQRRMNELTAAINGI